MWGWELTCGFPARRWLMSLRGEEGVGRRFGANVQMSWKIRGFSRMALGAQSRLHHVSGLAPADMEVEKSRGARLSPTVAARLEQAVLGLQESFSSKLRPSQECPAPAPQTRSTRLQGSVPGKKGTEMAGAQHSSPISRDKRPEAQRFAALGQGPARGQTAPRESQSLI